MSKHKPDYILLAVIIALVLFGLIILTSVSAEKPYYIKHQIIYGILIGSAGFFTAYKVNYKILQKLALPFLIVSLVLLGLVFIPKLGISYGGARRWVQISSVIFQPGEIVKLSFIIFLASLLSNKIKLAPFLIWSGLIALFFVFQPDIGTIGLIIMIAMIMYFTAGAKLWQIGICFLSGTTALLALIKLKTYRFNRLLAFLYPKLDPQGISYQINQALIALGSGGLFGLGWGYSEQRAFLPAVVTDSIFAVMGEELGFAGALILVCLFLILALRGFKIAAKTDDQFARLLAVGITSWLVLQAFVNIMAISGLIPLTGIPLPFVSYGSSAMIICLTSAGILLNISKYA
ncbi:MAG: FtsW/RodA/SpoVE family cell cycle protein [bacterium]